MILTSRAPLRVDFAGAWTDCAPFAAPFGGATLNAAITRYINGSLRRKEEEEVVKRRVSGPSGKHLIGSAPGLTVNYGSEGIPAGSGLGASATLNVVWTSLARGQVVHTLQEKMDIAARAYLVEKAIGIIGGKQDEYAAAVGGVNLFEFIGDEVRCLPVEVPKDLLVALRKRLVLCFTGASRLSSNIHEKVWGRFQQGRREVVDALFTLRNSAYTGRDLLERGELDGFGELLTVQFEAMKRLDISTTNDTIEKLFADLAQHLSGGKPCGAGGGGCVLFCAREDKEAAVIESKLRKAGVRVLDFQFDFEGLHMTEERDEE